MTRYERQFRRPLPPEYREIEVCAGCSHPVEDPRDCGCPCGTTFMAIRRDGKDFTCTDNYKLFPEKYDAVH